MYLVNYNRRKLIACVSSNLKSGTHVEYSEKVNNSGYLINPQIGVVVNYFNYQYRDFAPAAVALHINGVDYPRLFQVLTPTDPYGFTE